MWFVLLVVDKQKYFLANRLKPRLMDMKSRTQLAHSQLCEILAVLANNCTNTVVFICYFSQSNFDKIGGDAKFAFENKKFRTKFRQISFFSQVDRLLIPTAWLVISERFVIREHISLLQVNTLACYK